MRKTIIFYVNIPPEAVMARISLYTSKSILDTASQFRRKIKGNKFTVRKKIVHVFHDIPYPYFYRGLLLSGEVKKFQNGSQINMRFRYRLDFLISCIIFYLFLCIFLIIGICFLKNNLVNTGEYHIILFCLVLFIFSLITFALTISDTKDLLIYIQNVFKDVLIKEEIVESKKSIRLILLR